MEGCTVGDRSHLTSAERGRSGKRALMVGNHPDMRRTIDIVFGDSEEELAAFGVADLRWKTVESFHQL